jgi:hypothetical protein
MKQRLEPEEEIKRTPKIISLNYLEKLVAEQEKKDAITKNIKSNVIVGYDISRKPEENIPISPL